VGLASSLEGAMVVNILEVVDVLLLVKAQMVPGRGPVRVEKVGCDFEW